MKALLVFNIVVTALLRLEMNLPAETITPSEAAQPLAVDESRPAQPPMVKGEDYQTREWKVPAKFFQITTWSEPLNLFAPKPAYESQELLTAKGAKFPTGSFASYSRTTGKLVVKNTKNQLNIIDAILKKAEKENWKSQELKPNPEKAR